MTDRAPTEPQSGGNRDDLFSAIRTGRVQFGAGAGAADARVPARHDSADRAASSGERLAALVEEFVALDSDPDGPPVNMPVAYDATGGGAGR